MNKADRIKIYDLLKSGFTAQTIIESRTNRPKNAEISYHES